MEKFTVHQGVAAPMLQINIDTDAIIPSREMKLVSKQGLGEGLFAGWRYTLPNGREPNEDFVLNQAQYKNSSILLAGDNFGCGSSREHAVWALKEYGIKAIIAPGFGSIFYHNCIRNGILPVVLGNDEVLGLANHVEKDPQTCQVNINLLECYVSAFNTDHQSTELEATDSVNETLHFSFSILPAQREMLLEGLDGIALTLKSKSNIASFKQAYQRQYPWLA
ncbi:MAG: 3-isopropylmalate dehydratase small subunit [Alteromonadaceae bacterium]|uniref:3-isopropylmalate dehydratase small subunit n=1 Tax=Paraglaciecola chathamensis TaxID=368405 RepID=UPI000C4B71B6|nr:3-isopropylmalate dehydratase small subunit [Paraglaciecola agarilytica]MBN24986.1 3-isopropylmalate dehydratase small subunit [Alteromonadaceae bacterium]|tara:strand:- start:34406 stop:35071 length:666 start_codon:yes stop_codon:yes gene_type:complete